MAQDLKSAGEAFSRLDFGESAKVPHMKKRGRICAD